MLASGEVHSEVHEMLIEAAVPDSGCEGDGAGGRGRHVEGVACDLRAAGLDGVVVGDDLGVPDLMLGVEAAARIDEAVGEGVGALVEVTVGLDEAALKDDLACLVLDTEVDPGLVHVALLGHE